MVRDHNVLDKFASTVQETVTFYRERRQFHDLFKYIRKKAASASPEQNVNELNTLLDQILVDFCEQLRCKHLENLPVAELNRDVACKIFGRTVNVNFQGQNGCIKNLSTLYRRENCALAIPRSDSRILTFTLSLRTAVLEFERYELHCGPIHAQGKISIEARNTAMCVKVSMRLKENGQINTLEVTRAELSKCGKYKIRLTGFGNLGANSAGKLLIVLLLNKYKTQMKSELEKSLRNYIRQLIVKFLT